MISRNPLLLFFCFLLAISCGRQQEREKNFLNDPSLSNDIKLERYLESDSLMHRAFSNEDISLLRTFYKNQNFQPFVLEESSSKSKRDSIFNVLFNRSLAFGIPQEYLAVNNPKMHAIESDMTKVLMLARMVAIREQGFLDTNGRFKSKLAKPSMEQLMKLSQCQSLEQAGSMLQSMGPMNNASFRNLSEKIYAFAMKYPHDTLTLKTKDYSNEAQRTQLAKSVLKNKGYLKQENSSVQTFETALLTFKLQNGLDSTLEINDYTVEALCESTHHKLMRAALSLEKIRQSKLDFRRLVLINLPEYCLYFYANNSLKAKHRIVIGKRSNETPELNSEINSIVIFPSWKVPASIVKKEIMPDVRKNKNYLAKHHYIIRGYKDTSRLDVNAINLNSNGYSIIQSPGRWNSLGVIKFEFINAYSVYVHDTPQKGLFNRAVRSFSHGCMRCESPIELGKQLLTYDQEGRNQNSMPPSSIDSLVNKGKQRVITLKTKIPISVGYQTVSTLRDRLVFYLDIYQRDAKCIQKFAKFEMPKLNNL